MEETAVKPWNPCTCLVHRGPFIKGRCEKAREKDAQAEMVDRARAIPQPIHSLSDARRKVFELIHAERNRQEKLRSEGRFTHTCATPGITNEKRLAILTEEVGETAGEVLGAAGLAFDRGEGTKLQKEVLHVAAVAFAWLEYLVEHGD